MAGRARRRWSVVEVRRGRVGTRACVSASRMPSTRPVGRSSRAGERSKRGAAKETRTFCPRASFRVSCGTSRTRRGASAPTAPCSGDAIGHAVVVSQSESNCFLRARMAPCPLCNFLAFELANPRHATLKNKLFFSLVCQVRADRLARLSGATMSTQGDGDHPMDGSTHDATESVGGACSVRRRCLTPAPRAPCRRSNARFVQKSLFVSVTRGSLDLGTPSNP